MGLHGVSSRDVLGTSVSVVDGNGELVESCGTFQIVSSGIH